MTAAPLLAALAFAPSAVGPTQAVERGAVFEVERVVSGRGAADGNPLAPPGRVRFDGPGGRAATVDLFFDGTGASPADGRPVSTWKARFAPDAVGDWTYEVLAPPGGARVTEPPGAFRCVPSDRPGPPRLPAGSSHFVRANAGGEPAPWFYLADTAWNGALKSDAGDWERYLDARERQGFTAVQFVGTQWRGGEETIGDKPFVVEGGRVVGLNVEKLRTMDARVAAVAARGLAPAPVLLWALGETDPGRAWEEADAVAVARHLKARWGAYGCVWLLGGDGKYEDRDRWRRVGAAVFPEGESDGSGAGPGPPRGPVTLHMAGRKFHAGELLGEPWLDFVGYQSGHGASDADLRWLTLKEPPGWADESNKPAVNLEPNYEAHPAYGTGVPHDAHHVRRAAWWSVLIAPPAGVGYGHGDIWPWAEAPGPIEGHGSLAAAGTWEQALDAEGAADMGALRAFLEAGPWTDLRPAPDLVAAQSDDPAAFAAAARTADGAWTVIYTPVGGPVRLTPGAVAGRSWESFDPRTGERAPLAADPGGTIETPAGHDWVIAGRAN